VSFRTFYETQGWYISKVQTVHAHGGKWNRMKNKVLWINHSSEYLSIKFNNIVSNKGSGVNLHKHAHLNKTKSLLSVRIGHFLKRLVVLCYKLMCPSFFGQDL
jgi:hypothetical protein